MYGAHAQFFDVFDEFKGRPFHMTGESYGVSTAPAPQASRS